MDAGRGWKEGTSLDGVGVVLAGGVTGRSWPLVRGGDD